MSKNVPVYKMSNVGVSIDLMNSVKQVLENSKDNLSSSESSHSVSSDGEFLDLVGNKSINQQIPEDAAEDIAEEASSQHSE